MRRWLWFVGGLLLILAVLSLWMWIHRPPDRLFVASRVWLSFASSGAGLTDADAQNLAGLVLRDIAGELLGSKFASEKRVYVPGEVSRGGGCDVRVENAVLRVGDTEVVLHSMCIVKGKLCVSLEVKGEEGDASLSGIGRIYPNVSFDIVVTESGLERGSGECLH